MDSGSRITGGGSGYAALLAHAGCVFYYCRTYYKAVRVGGGGEWRTCAMRDDEPRPVWLTLPKMVDFAASAGMELFHVGKFGIFGTRTHPF